MTIKNKKIAKRACAIMLSAAMAMPIGIPSVNVSAAETEKPSYATVYSDEGYELVWNDEFEGDSLNTKDWNVEAHDPGWVNAELQRYVSADDMGDNISVANGELKITPTAEKKVASGVTDLLDGNSFDNSWIGSATATVSGGKATITVPKSESGDPWDVQYQKAGMTLENGHSYTFSMKAKSDVKRKVTLNIANTDTYASYGGNTFEIGTEEDEYTYTFTMGECDKGKAAIQFNLGKIDDEDSGKTAAALELYNVSLIDNTLASDSGEVDVKTAYNYTSGRINTQNKHDFTYGRFECRAKVPSGKGYLPAFWLMATDENNYGQWPQCGEMDIMEVMGQETNKSYHTIHYGYDSGSGHRENQGTKTLKAGDFSSEYHTYTFDWEPGKLTWYVDGEEVYTTNDWFTGKDEESQLSYPAPFDQDFYVILNLAVGGSWVGYPTQEVVDNIIKGNADQSFYVDYVRVYQKEDEYYEALEENVEKPVHEVVFRNADANGNYVVNGDFSKDLKTAGSSDDNFELHLEADAKDTTYEIKNNEITITPSVEGGVDYSVQLKQTGVPMYKGWEYELSFDAYADEQRTMIIDIEGPDKGYTRYFGDKKETITTEKKNYKYTFTMDQKTDANGSLEFCLGNQDSTAPVHISNIKLTHISGETNGNTIEKTVRADGNYIYNGSFDQGDKRLGYWEMDEEDAARVTVTNNSVEGSNGKVRELCAKIEVPGGTSKVNPITISQSELAPIVKGLYDISFDAYMEDGSADAITVNVAGKEFTPEITTKKATYSKQFKFRDNLTRDESNVTITFTKPGTYYLDNVILIESALLKNGSFDSGVSGYEPYVNSPAKAAYVVDNMNGNDNTFVMSIEDVGTEAWHIQLIQDGITLEKDKTYELSFKIKSSEPRQVLYDLECNGNLSNTPNAAWANYSGTGALDITSEWLPVSEQFTMTYNTDTAARFKIAMGKTDVVPEGKHDVYVDDIVLKEIGAVLTDEQKAAKEEADKEAIVPVVEKINAIGEVELTDASKAKIDDASKAFEELTIDQQDLISDELYNVLENAKKTYAALKKAADDKAAADAVIEKINAIGEVDATDASKVKIDEAKKAYEKLTKDQKALADKSEAKNKLDQAEKDYKATVAAKEEAEKKAAEDAKKAEEDEKKAAEEDAKKAVQKKADDKKTDEAVVEAYDAAKGSSNKNGVAEAGETAITEQGTFTAKNAKEASYTPSEAAKNSANVEIPATVKIDGVDVEVTEIAPKAFKGDKKLTKLTVGANIKTIGEGAFQNDTKLKSVKFKGKKISSIAKNTFAGDKSLTSVDLSKQSSLKSIGAYAFKNCKKLKTFKVNGNKLKKVDKTAFKGCPNKKSVKVTIYTKTKAQYKKVVKMFKKAGLTKVTFKRSKTK